MRARASKGEEYRHKTRRGEQRTENEEQRKIVVVQRACESLHSWGSHMEMRGMRPQLPSIFISDIDKARPGYLYYNGYSMHEVSKKKEKIKRTFKPATGCAVSYGSGKRC